MRGEVLREEKNENNGKLEKKKTGIVSGWRHLPCVKNRAEEKSSGK